MLRRAASASSLILKHGPRSVLLAREAKIRGAMQKKGELRPFISFLRTRALRAIVEIGTYRGGTLWLWCQIAAPNACIVSIDLPGGPFGGGYDDAQGEHFPAFARASQRLILIQCDSHLDTTADEVFTALNGRPIDLLFIDGDHTYSGVKRDYEMYAPLVAPGGIIAFHDILPHTHERDCQVNIFWEELKLTRPAHREFVDTDAAIRTQWGGIGAVFAD